MIQIRGDHPSGSVDFGLKPAPTTDIVRLDRLVVVSCGKAYETDLPTMQTVGRFGQFWEKP